MKKIIIWIITLFLLTSCYSNPENIKKIEELESKVQKYESKDNLFTKNLKCHNLWYKNHLTDDQKIVHSFYSDKLNTCVRSVFSYQLNMYIWYYKVITYPENTVLKTFDCDELWEKCFDNYNDYIKTILPKSIIDESGASTYIHRY